MLPCGLMPRCPSFYECLSYSCGYRDLIYREGPVAITPATAGLYLAHFWAAFLPSKRPFWLLIFHSSHCG